MDVERAGDRLEGTRGHTVGAPSAMCSFVLLEASVEDGGQLMGENPAGHSLTPAFTVLSWQV